MSDQTAFREQFQSAYGNNYKARPDYSRCAAEVCVGFSFSQCTRKNGHGPHGAWCKQHDPVARKAKAEAQKTELAREWARKDAERKFRTSCVEAIRRIAEGHNDPRGLAMAIVADLDAALERNGGIKTDE